MSIGEAVAFIASLGAAIYLEMNGHESKGLWLLIVLGMLILS
jgi:hypothetical protein